jgi:hypothetical protein
VPIRLPYRFDTSSVWHTILKGAFALNAVLVLGFFYSLVAGPWTKAIAVAGLEVVVLGFTRVFVRYQEGSVGVLSSDRVVIEPNVLLGITLPGPRGTYLLDRFSAVRVEFRSGTIDPSAQSTGPHETVWLVGKPATPDVAVARTSDRAGRAVGQELGALLGLPVEEVGAPIEIRL